MSCGVGCRYGSDLALLCLWCRLAAVALIRPLAWEPSYAVDAALKRQKDKKKKKNSEETNQHCMVLTKPQTLFTFRQFLTNVLLLFQDPALFLS